MAWIFAESGSRVLIKRLIVVVIVEAPHALLDILFSVLYDHGWAVISLFDNNIAIVFNVIEDFVFKSRDIAISFVLYSLNDISLDCCFISIQEQILASIGSDSVFPFQEGVVKQTFIRGEIGSGSVGIVFIIVLMKVDLRRRRRANLFRSVRISRSSTEVLVGTNLAPRDRTETSGSLIMCKDRFTTRIYVISNGCDIAALFTTIDRAFYQTSLMGSSREGW